MSVSVCFLFWGIFVKSNWNDICKTLVVAWVYQTLIISLPSSPHSPSFLPISPSAVAKLNGQLYLVFVYNPCQHWTLRTLHPFSPLVFTMPLSPVFFLPLQFLFRFNIHLSVGSPNGSGVKSACQRGRWRLGRSPAGGHGSHPSILGWRLPRTAEPGGPQALGSQSRTGLSRGAGRWSDWRGLRAECERWRGGCHTDGASLAHPPPRHAAQFLPGQGPALIWGLGSEDHCSQTNWKKGRKILSSKNLGNTHNPKLWRITAKHSKTWIWLRKENYRKLTFP